MFTQYTFEDWQGAPEDKRETIDKIIKAYKASEPFKAALSAIEYFNARNEGIKNKFLIKLDAYEQKDPETGAVKMVRSEHKVEGNRVVSDFFYRFVIQQNQHLLGNGATLDEGVKEKLGFGFDTTLSCMGEKALVTGCCWGFWNNDHLEMIESCKDGLTGAVALVGETDSVPRVLIQFWQLSSTKPLRVRVIDSEQISLYKADKDGKLQLESQQSHKQIVVRDSMGTIAQTGSNYGVLPVFPLKANDEMATELRPSVKSKIDAFDRITSDFCDNLEMANEVIWVLNNFGGDRKDILSTIAQIHELRTVVNISDGTGSGSTAEQQTFEVPHAARQTALEILRKELYRDAMAMDTDALSGTSLSSEAIETAAKELNLKCDRFEWQVFDFMQKLLALIGVKTEKISFKRQNIINQTQIIENIYAAREDLDRRTRLQMNPSVPDDKIDDIMNAKAAEEASGLSDTNELQREMEKELKRLGGQSRSGNQPPDGPAGA